MFDQMPTSKGRPKTNKRKHHKMKTFVTGLLKGRITRRRLLAAVLPAAGVSLAWAGERSDEHGRDDHHSQSYKLEGSWIAKVVGMPLQWTYTLTPDSSGRKAAMFGTIQVAIRPAVVNPDLFPDLEYISDMVGELVMTGHDTMKFTAVWYGMKKAVPFDKVVFIGVNSGKGKFTGPGQSQVTHHLAFYDPIVADADGDGLPDPGQAPALCLPATISLDTRVPLLVPCTP
jgi:hypothetical protein